MERVPRDRAVFFLRNKGMDVRMFQPGATKAEIAAESGFWRTVIDAGTVVSHNGAAHVPSTYNAEFLAAAEGLPFDDFVSVGPGHRRTAGGSAARGRRAVPAAARRP